MMVIMDRDRTICTFHRTAREIAGQHWKEHTCNTGVKIIVITSKTIILII